MGDCKIKPVYFNIVRDAVILAYADKIDNFSDWVKCKLQKESEGRLELDIEGMVIKLLDERLPADCKEAKPASRIEPSHPIGAQQYSFDGFI